ncbi:MAG: chorismate mutase [Acholeplasmataceae bacterium]|jgi:monofunctional chorismate mutase|nr:chorismate mutase [Acholeplasmataceae bacterium]
MNLNELRKEIDVIDEQMMELFKKRMSVSKNIGKLKKVMGLPIIDNAREEMILEKRKAALGNNELIPYYQAFLIKLFDLSKEYQHHV